MTVNISAKKNISNRAFNGETVNYSICFFAVFFMFLVLKQVFQIAFSIPAAISVGIGAAIGAAVLFFLNRKYVFNHSINTKLPLQIAFYLLNILIDIGFFTLCRFIFGKLIEGETALIYLITALAVFFFNFYFQKLIVFDNRADAVSNNGGRAYKLFYENRFILLSILLAGISISFVFLVSRLFPFGNFTVMRMDLYHQYGPLFCELYDRVTQHKSFLYSWYAGGGSDFLGNYFNYLSSPLSLIIFLFNRKDMAFAITTLVAVKGILSAASFSLYLKLSQKGHSYTTAAFGVFYAFCGYFLAYYWNIMWIDAMILFPLIILGIEKIIDENKPVLYIASLCILFWSSYYMGYMVCIFSVIYFLAYFALSTDPAPKSKIIKEENKQNPIQKLLRVKFVNRGVTFAAASLLCGALCAFMLIPVYMILQQSSATQDTFPNSFESYFNIFNFLTSHLAGLETTIRSSGDDVLPNIYCGILTIILLPLYLLNKEIRLKEKAIYILLLLFLLFSFDTNYSNFVWHAFHFPNDLPYRFSYMYSFILLVIAFRTLKRFKAIEYRDIALSGMLWVAALVIFEKFPTTKFTDTTVYISLAFVIIWTGVLLLIKKNKLSKLLVGITIIAIAFSEVIIADTSSYVFTQKQSDYVENYDSYREAIDYTYNKDKSLFRSELCYLDTRMDPCLYGYRGMSTFTSMAYEKYSGNQYSLGMAGNRINSYTYNTQTPVYNMMYALKYVIQKQNEIKPSDSFYESFYSTKDNSATVYKNKYFLPLAFETTRDISDWINEEGNPFEVQEDFIDRAAGVSDIFTPIEYVSTKSENASCEDVTENGTSFYTLNDSEDKNGSIDVTFKSQKDGNVYVYITSPEIQNVNYFWNNDEESKYQNIDEPYIIDLGSHKKGEIITASLSLSGTESDSSYFEIYAYNVDEDVLKSAYELLSLGALDITSFKETEISGNINAGYDGYIYTSIPYDEGWHIYIDGNEVKKIKIGDCQLAAYIKKGKHEVSFKFIPKGLKTGALISGASWLAVLLIIILRKTKLENLFKFNKNKENIQ